MSTRTRTLGIAAVLVSALAGVTAGGGPRVRGRP